MVGDVSLNSPRGYLFEVRPTSESKLKSTLFIRNKLWFQPGCALMFRQIQHSLFLKFKDVQ